MAVTLVGEIIDSADSATGFTNGNISGDDDFVEGTGAVGVKASATTIDLVQTSLGGTNAPYDFSVGGTEEGWHIVMWFNTKTPVNATSGLQVRVGNGTNTGDWYVIGTSFYKGGFVTRVIDTAADFDAVSGWSLTGNPAQLTAVSECGAVFTTTTSIMGSFNNVQVDQFTAGLGLRVDAGTIGTPNTFEIVRAADEDTAFYGWWASSNGAVIGKGKLYIGPATGTATSVFTDSAFSVIFADERVAAGFYEIAMRGANTDVSWELASIAAANATNARWSITVETGTNSFEDLNGVWTGSDVITLSANSVLTGTTIIDGTSMIQTSADLNDITVLDPNVGSGVAYLTSNNPSLISGCTFESSGAGHAIEIDTAGTYTFTDNTFGTGYSGTGNNAAIWFNPSGGTGDLVLNASGGNITAGNIRNSSSGSVTVNNNVNVTLTGLVNPTEVRVYTTAGVELQGQEDVTTGSYIISQSAGIVVNIRIFALNYLPADITNFTIPSSNTSLPIQQVFDRNYSNP